MRLETLLQAVLLPLSLFQSQLFLCFAQTAATTSRNNTNSNLRGIVDHQQQPQQEDPSNRRVDALESEILAVESAQFSAAHDEERRLQTNTPVFINEFHYDDSGTDENESVEVAFPEGMLQATIEAYKLVLYNGRNGRNYKTYSLSIFDFDHAPSGGLRFATYFFPSRIQNGGSDGDGIVLVDNAGSVVQFICYEGSFTATRGPADDLTCFEELSVSESSSTGATESLQLGGGPGCVYEDFSWQPPNASTIGQANLGQSISCTAPEPTSAPTAGPTPFPSPEPTPFPTQAPTSEPTNVPTLSSTSNPTLSPTTQPTMIPGGCVTFELIIEFDAYPEDVSWTLVDLNTGETTLSGGPYSMSSGPRVEIQECIADSRYNFTISDSWGDALCSDNDWHQNEDDCGFYEVIYNGAIVAAGADYGAGDSTTFGGPEDTPNPTTNPTSNPTLAPTPTLSTPNPTINPTPNPSAEQCSVNNLPSFGPSVEAETVVSFFAMGDVPYDEDERFCLNEQLRNIDLTAAGGPSFMIHIGDIKAGISDCNEEAYSDIAEIFTHPQNAANYDPADCFFIPGDNEWNDCDNPDDAWSLWTEHFGPNNPYGFGNFSSGATLVERQTGVERLPGVDRSENFAFFLNQTLFIGLNLVGSGAIGDEDVRLAQNFDWVNEKLSFYSNTTYAMKAAVVFGHASLPDNPNGVKAEYFGNPFQNLLQESYLDLPVMYFHGDGHSFCVDYPNSSIPNLVDVEVEDGDVAPPLLVSILRNPDDDTHIFAIDQRGGNYPDSCPEGNREITWGAQVPSPSQSPSSLPQTPPSPSQSPLPQLEYVGNNGGPGFPLGECEGDCDDDSECQSGLRCFQRDDAPVIPGCEGTAEGGSDYCHIPQPGVLSYYGDNGDPSSAFPLGRCEGDCDGDGDCQGDLKCFSRGGNDAVPHCSGTGESGKDYCYSEYPSGPNNPPNALSHTDACSSLSPCGKCEGDCNNNDSNCQTDLGLVCFQRDGAESVPGCVTGGSGDILGADYCHEPPANGPVTYIPGDNTVSQNGLWLSTGLTSRIIAVSGENVQYANGSESDITFHGLPDGAGVFKDNSTGGWIYVSNSEEDDGDGGVGAITFDQNGNVTDYKMILTGRNRNCGGGKTYWNTWLSCEEASGGQVWEVDPWGNSPGRETRMGGDGNEYESAAYDNRDESNPTFYITTDVREGPVVKFTPDEQAVNDAILSGDYSDLLHTEGTMNIEYLILAPDPTDFNKGTFSWSPSLAEGETSASDHYPYCEGIDIRDGQVYFTCKDEKHLFILDLDNFTYERSSTVSGAFEGQPDQVARILNGTGDDSILYFCEDISGGANGGGVHGRDAAGNFFTILTGNTLTGETSGLDFSPDNMHMYVSFQHEGIIFDITRTDGYPFGGQRLDIKYHSANDPFDPVTNANATKANATTRV